MLKVTVVANILLSYLLLPSSFSSFAFLVLDASPLLRIRKEKVTHLTDLHASLSLSLSLSHFHYYYLVVRVVCTSLLDAANVIGVSLIGKIEDKYRV